MVQKVLLKSCQRILMEYEELCSGNTVKEHQKDYERFFTVKETPKRGRKIEYKPEAIERPQEEQHQLVCLFYGSTP